MRRLPKTAWPGLARGPNAKVAREAGLIATEEALISASEDDLKADRLRYKAHLAQLLGAKTRGLSALMDARFTGLRALKRSLALQLAPAENAAEPPAEPPADVKEAMLVSRAGIAKDVLWAAHHVGNATVQRADAPSGLGYSLWLWARSSPKAMDTFFASMVTRLMPHKADIDEAEERRVGSRKVEELLEEFLRAQEDR